MLPQLSPATWPGWIIRSFLLTLPTCQGLPPSFLGHLRSKARLENPVLNEVEPSGSWSLWLCIAEMELEGWGTSCMKFSLVAGDTGTWQGDFVWGFFQGQLKLSAYCVNRIFLRVASTEFWAAVVASQEQPTEPFSSLASLFGCLEIKCQLPQPGSVNVIPTEPGELDLLIAVAILPLAPGLSQEGNNLTGFRALDITSGDKEVLNQMSQNAFPFLWQCRSSHSKAYLPCVNPTLLSLPSSPSFSFVSVGKA